MFSVDPRKNRSLATSIKRMVFITSVTVLLIASASFLVMEWMAAKQGLLNRISLMSELVAEHSTASVSFGDVDTAERFLKSLKNDKDVELAAIIDEEGQIFATYQKYESQIKEELSQINNKIVDPASHHFSISALLFKQQISLDDQPIGTLFIKVSLNSFWVQLMTYLGAITTVLVILICILERLSNRFKRKISKPIEMILQRMSEVQNDSNYSIRINVNRSDELGRIMHQFNDMVSKIEIREDELIQKNKVIEKYAFYDSLTGLPNRRLLTEQLKHEIQSAIRKENVGATFFIDLDNFKTINDSLGHDTGDIILIEVAKRIDKSLRESDICARIGGDEFLAILPDLGMNTQAAMNDALSIAEKLRKVIAQPIQISERSFHTTASIGITLFNDSTESAQDALKQSDMAMYAAKQLGRNCTHFFSDEMQEEATNRLNIEEELRQALNAPWEHFELYYQAQVDKDGQCTGAEALIRWHHPQHGLVLPGKFIPVAEITGLIIPLGNWIIDSACKQLSSWQDEGQHLRVAINVSSNQFLYNGFAEFVSNKLSEYSIAPHSLEIEITESLILDDKNRAVAIMTQLRKLGVSFSIDDFGTGYSSLQYLTTLPISKLKIDQSFVRNIPTEAHDAAVVKTIILMTQNMGLEVLAEGVENSDELSFLLENGCDLFQGYLFSKPVTVSEFEEQHLCIESKMTETPC